MPARSSVFVDTAYLVALIDRTDGLHTRARQLAIAFVSDRARLHTSDAILIELADYFCGGPFRRAALEWIDAIRKDGRWDVVPLDRPLLRDAEARYRRYDDKNWSMTDCISMEAMSQRRIREVATADRGFEQAGFRALMA